MRSTLVRCLPSRRVAYEPHLITTLEECTWTGSQSLAPNEDCFIAELLRDGSTETCGTWTKKSGLEEVIFRTVPL